MGAVDRGDRVPLESVLAVVVVLDHEGAGALRPFEQRQATFEGQDRAGRELMGGGDVDEARPAGPSPELVRVEAITVDRDRNQTSAGGRARRAGPGKAGHPER